MLTENTCVLCGDQTTLTFEHIPPQCAFNNTPIYVQNYEHLFNETGYLFGKKSVSNRGFGKKCLCAHCNNSTGNWYVKDFCEFTRQGVKILEQNVNPYITSGSYMIKPLNVLKQILLMFVCADSSGVLNKHSGVTDYLLNRRSELFPQKINIYLYSNSSPVKRMIGYSFASNIETGERFQWSEINYKPFGYFLTYDSSPPNNYMVNITGFNEKPYDYLCNVNLNIARLKVSNLAIGHYDNVSVR
ncbi:hypothetical protein [Pseudopedobacter beijingensis]|uniref:HNH endonuclease n=1 Tax=Pseudopedobacter beijingensis TaxID=1207056 RepID=A0ABW4IAG1_9SPHI